MSETEAAPVTSDIAPQYKARELEDVITLRRRIMEAFDALQISMKTTRISAEMVQKCIEMKYGEAPSLHQLGNNFRILRNQGMLEMIRSRGYSWWSRTPRKYKEEFPIRMLLPLPKAMYERCTNLSKAAGMSRVKFVRNMVALGLQSLDPLKRAEDYVSYLEEWKNSAAVRGAVAAAEAPLKPAETTTPTV